MATAATRVGTQPPAVKCRICGRPSLRGSKLCDECVAAVKRARHMSTLGSELLPQAGPRRSASLRAMRVPRSPSTRSSWIPATPAAWGVLVAFTVFGAAVVGTAFLAVQEISEQALKGQIPPSASEPSATRPNILPHAHDGAVGATGIPAMEKAPVEPIAPVPVEPPRAEAPTPVVESPQVTPPPEKRAPRKVATETRKKPATRAVPAATDTAVESKATIAGQATIAAPKPAIAAPSPTAAPAPAPPVPDRWETMNAALAACSRETLLGGVMCTERVRYQFCEGFWGQVPQCRAATRPGSSR